MSDDRDELAGGDGDQADGDQLVCRECGASFDHHGRGRKPLRCPQCRGTRRRPDPTDDEPAAPKRPRGIEALRTNVQSQLTMLGMSIALFDPFDAQVILTRAKTGADALANLAQTNPKIRKLLETSIEAAGWGPVLAWGASVGLPIAAHHGLIRGVPDPAAKPPPGPDNGTL